MEVDSEISLSNKIINQKKQVSEYIVEETMLKIGSEFIWLWIAIELEDRQILVQNITKERNMLVVERCMYEIEISRSISLKAQIMI
jgi:putative transposase